MTIIKESTNKCWRGFEGNTLSLLVAIYIDTTTIEDMVEIPLKTRNKTTYDPAILLLGIYPEKTKIEKDICISFFIAVLFMIARTWK